MPLLRKFLEVETESIRHSGSKIIALEGPQLSDRYSLTTLKGLPDRVDHYAKGLVLIDYKSSTDNPSAQEMMNEGYRLQLPFYALAAQKHFKIEPRALQFIAFDKKGTRTKGLFFREDISLEEGSLIRKKPHARSASEVTLPPDEVWATLRQRIQEAVQAMEKGDFSLRPKYPKEECPRCRMRDACGERRYQLDQMTKGELNV
jgi:ATP-dependent helicase/DNAse subunit B